MAGGPGRPNLYEEISRRLLADIGRSSADELAPIRTLAREYGVAVVTMAKAVNALAEQGVIDVHQGRRVRIRRSHDPGPPRLPASTGRVLEKIRSGILQGWFRAGQVLPKIKFFTISERASTATVSEALSMLAHEGLIHKQARRWVVGPVPPSSNAIGPVRADPSLRPAALLVLPSVETWSSLCIHSHSRQFLETLGSELDRYDVLPITCVIDPTPVVAIPSGIQAIAERVRSIGPTYQGAVVIGEPALAIEPHLRECLHALLRFRKPVVWIDREVKAPHLDRREFHSSLLYRLSGRGPETEKIAVETLAALGHRQVAYFDNVLYRDEQWNRDRIAALTQEGRRCSLDVAVVPQNEGLWNRIRRDDTLDKPAFFRYCLSQHASLQKRGKGIAAPRIQSMYRTRLSNTVPSLTSVVFHSFATALIAPNDWLASAYAIWLAQMGVAVPARLSLLSFDNDVALRHYPISTVDLGLGHLGYCAAHILVGDIPIRSDRYGNIVALPRLVDRGSLAKPRRGKINTALTTRRPQALLPRDRGKSRPIS